MLIYKLNKIKYMLLKELYDLLRSEKEVIQFLKIHGVLMPTPYCSECGNIMKMNVDSSVKVGFVYTCQVRTGENQHRKKQYLTKGSFFETSMLQLSQIVEIIYLWSAEIPIKQISSFTGISKKTLVQWSQYLRDICSWKLVTDPLMFGGPGKRVQIDESKFMKLKHHRGEPRGNAVEGWVFGIYDEESKNVHFQFVNNRKRETLFPIIKRVVLPETLIWSDEYATYTGGPNRNIDLPTPLSLLGPYQHQFVNHSEHFVDPITGCHTNSIEGSWALCKRKFKYMFGTSSNHIPSYLDEFIWRRRFVDGLNTFNVILSHIALRYEYNT